MNREASKPPKNYSAYKKQREFRDYASFQSTVNILEKRNKKLMESKPSVDEIEPFCKWRKEEQQDVLEVHLQGFKRDELSVQINNLGVLTISGERRLDHELKRVCFSKQVNVSKDCKRDDINAKFSGGILYLAMPKKSPLLLAAAQTQRQNQENENAKQSNEGTATALSKMSKPSENELVSGRKMNQTALKLGAMAAAVMLVAAAVAFVLSRYRRGFHTDD